MSPLLILAAAAAGVVEDGTRAEDTVGFRTFEQYCLDAKKWKDTPDLERAGAEELSSLESGAFASAAGTFHVFLASAEPRVLLGLQWQEMQSSGVPVRNGRTDESQRRSVALVGGRCIVFSHENVWQGMTEALGRVTGVTPQDISNRETGFDGLTAMDLNAARPSGEPRAHSFAATRFDGTTMYRAIM